MVALFLGMFCYSFSCEFTLLALPCKSLETFFLSLVVFAAAKAREEKRRMLLITTASLQTTHLWCGCCQFLPSLLSRSLKFLFSLPGTLCRVLDVTETFHLWGLNLNVAFFFFQDSNLPHACASELYFQSLKVTFLEWPFTITQSPYILFSSHPIQILFLSLIYSFIKMFALNLPNVSSAQKGRNLVCLVIICTIKHRRNTQ